MSFFSFSAPSKPTVPPEREFFKSLWGDEDYCDITIKLGKRKIHCHKVVICNRSEYFKKLCGKGSHFAESSQKVVELKDDDVQAVERMLIYLYFGPYIPSDGKIKGNEWEFHAEVARVADKYLVNDLKSTAKDKCLELLTKMLDPAQVCDAILAIKAKFSDMDDLAKKAASMQKDHLNALLLQPRYVESLGEDEIKEHFTRVCGIINGQVEKEGWICQKCDRIYDWEIDCLNKSCNGITYLSKYWIAKK